MREFFSQAAMSRKAMTFFAALAILVILRPFGSYRHLNLWEQITLWTVFLMGIGGVMHLTAAWLLSVPALARWPRAVPITLAAALGAVPGSAIVVFVNMVFLGINMASAFPMIWSRVFFLAELIMLVEFRGWQRRPAAAEEAAPAADDEVENPAPQPAAQPTPLLERLPPAKRGPLISLSMKDHYVEVTTEKGTELILMRFSDAIRELAGAAGARLHRSHWVAADHLERLERQGKRRWAVLSDGRKLPVSATYAKAAEALIAARMS